MRVESGECGIGFSFSILNSQFSTLNSRKGVKKITEQAVALTFETDLHENLTITVPKAKPSITDAEVVSAMTRIIGAGAVAGTAGEPIAIKKAEMITIDTTDYDLN